MITQSVLKDIFVTHSGLLTEAQFTGAVAAAEQSGESLATYIAQEYFISEAQFIALLAEHFSLPGTHLLLQDIDPEALHIISKDFAVANGILPFAIDEETLHVATIDPTNTEVVNQLTSSSGRTVKLYITSETAIERASLLYNGSVLELMNGKLSADVQKLSPSSLVEQLVEAATLAKASDIHIEPYETQTIIRIRVDGALQTVVHLPTDRHEQLIARIKVLAQLKVDEKRAPQDGRFSTAVGKRDVDVRVSLVPSVWGEKAVMRVLVKGSVHYNLSTLGFAEDDLETVQRHLQSSHGMILLCGPTGSGKTTTLYSCINAIASDRIDVVNISTVEDPIEYTIPRVTQIQIQPTVDLTFANGLRSLLRQDPDVLMVGEIRDNETASVATRAALVGRLLLSSVHANDALSVIPRMQSMETDPYLLADTLRLVISQRLVRRLCLHCRKSQQIDTAQADRLYKHYDLQSALDILHAHGEISDETRSGDSLRLYHATGCEYCSGTGYVGRVAVYEILEIDDVLRSHIVNRDSLHTIRETRKNAGKKTMFTDGLLKSLNGVTDLEEVIRAVM